MSEAEVANLLEPARQYMLQEPTNELLGTYPHRFVRTRSAGAVRERDHSCGIGAMFDLDDSLVADRNSEYVRGQIPQCQPAIANRLAIDIPSFVPNLRCDPS